MARRALRFERLRAEAAYPHDRHDMRSCLRERLKARIFVRARRQCELASTGVALASCDPRGVCFRAHGPTHPMDGSQPHRWARRTFLNGKSDDRCEGAPAPPAHMCHSLPARCELSTVLVLTVRRQRALPTAPPPIAPPPPPQPQSLPFPPPPSAAVAAAVSRCSCVCAVPCVLVETRVPRAAWRALDGRWRLRGGRGWQSGSLVACLRRRERWGWSMCRVARPEHVDRVLWSALRFETVEMAPGARV